MDIDMVVTGSLEDFLRYDGDFATGSRFNLPDQNQLDMRAVRDLG